MPTIYRDGAAHRRQSIEALRQRVHTRAERLAPRVRRLPVALRDELAEAAAAVQHSRDADALQLEDALTSYDRALEAALARLQLRRRSLRTPLLGLGALCVMMAVAVASRDARADPELAQICAEHAACQEWGACSPNPSLQIGHGPSALHTVCHAQSDADCTQVCAREGLCEPVYGRCGATHDDHCRQSDACRDEGRCVQSGLSCVLPPEASMSD